MNARSWITGLVLLALVAATGCVRPSGPTDVRDDLEAVSGVKLKQEFGITVTRSGMWLARKVINTSDEDDDIPSLKGIKRVEVGVYEVRGLRKGFDEPARIGMEDFAKSWEPLVQVREDNEHVFVLFQEKEQSIRRMLIVVAEDEEWVIVRLKGKLDLILEESMRMAFDEIDRPELYDKTLQERGLEPLPGGHDSDEKPGTVIEDNLEISAGLAEPDPRPAVDGPR